MKPVHQACTIQCYILVALFMGATQEAGNLPLPCPCGLIPTTHAANTSTPPPLPLPPATWLMTVTASPTTSDISPGLDAVKGLTTRDGRGANFWEFRLDGAGLLLPILLFLQLAPGGAAAAACLESALLIAALAPPDAVEVGLSTTDV